MSEWKRVPVEPTKEMIDAAYSAEQQFEDATEGAWCGLSDAYRAMLDAAPQPPVTTASKPSSGRSKNSASAQGERGTKQR